jgi:hypothetical protein
MTHPIFVVCHITQHVIQVQDASVSMLQPVDLHPVVMVLVVGERQRQRERERERERWVDR